MIGTDRFGQDLTGADPHSVGVWDIAITEVLDFRGDPSEQLHELKVTDDACVMGLVVTTAGAVLGGDDPLSESLQTDLAVLEARCGHTTERERAHAGAVVTLVDGNFTAAAARWEAIGASHPHDVVATKMAHDIYLHVGDDARRLQASTAVIGRLRVGDHPLQPQCPDRGHRRHRQGALVSVHALHGERRRPRHVAGGHR